jgi:membrane protein DedA with SNARE-associated domain
LDGTFQRKQEDSTLLTHLTDILTTLITNLYVTTGLVGILLAMAIESCCIPLPSEIVMPLAGVMIASGKLLHGMSFGVSLLLVAVAGALGCLLGSMIAFGIGYSGGRPLLLKYGRYVLISQHDADTADHFFQKWGSATVFFSRLLPVVRTYISLPAGISKMPFVKFVLYTFLGSLPWCLALAYAGYVLGNHLDTLGPIFHGLDVVIVLVVVVLAVLYVWRHIRNDRKARAAHAAAGDAGTPAQSQSANFDAWNQAQQGWGQQQSQQPQQPQQFSQNWGQSQEQPGWGQPQQQMPAQPMSQQGWGQAGPQQPQQFQQPQWGQQPAQSGWGQSVPQQQLPQQQFQPQQGWGQSVPTVPQQLQQGWGQPQQQGWGQPQSQPGQPWLPQADDNDRTVRRG